MKHNNQTELDMKIKSFMARKTVEYPELIITKKTAWTNTTSHGIAGRLFTTRTSFKPYLQV